jgi:hypothetical protein
MKRLHGGVAKLSYQAAAIIPMTAFCAFAAFALSGCTLLPMKNLQPVIAPLAAGACNDTHAFLADEISKAANIHYTLPSDSIPLGGGARRVGVATADNFEAYKTAVQNRVASKLPPALAQHRVTIAFTEFLTSASAEAQLDAQVANSKNVLDAGTIATERASIQKHSASPNLKQSELKDFGTKLFNLQLKHGPADFMASNTNLDALGASAKALASTRPKLDTVLVAYLKAYYDGKFYDRMGTAITKPQLPSVTSLPSLSNFSVPDSEIIAAETVLLEFLIDCIDPTPVMGDKTDHPSGTTFYPGNSSNEPTALTTNLAVYVTLPQDGCGITVKNVWVLKDLANAASDEAAAVGGLIVNTPGGISFGLGVLGKISIGDNQTLSDLVKTAASELALRATLATSYFTLRNITFNPIQP